MNTHEANGKEITPIQGEAIRLLLTEPKMEVVADRLGVDRATVWRWLQDSRFKVELAQQEEEAINAGTRLLVNKYHDAVATVVRAMEGKEPVTAMQLKASNILLMRLPDLLSVAMIHSRLAELERRLLGAEQN